MDCENAVAAVLERFGNDCKDYKKVIKPKASCKSLRSRDGVRSNSRKWESKQKYYLSKKYLEDLRSNPFPILKLNSIRTLACN